MLEIQILGGIHARPLVDPFYEKNGGRRCARDEDLFFLAMDDGKVLGCGETLEVPEWMSESEIPGR